MEIPIAIPKNPKRQPKKIYKNLNILKVKLNEKSGIEKEHIPVNATIIIKTGLTMFALTAASPKIKAPNNSYCWSNWCRNSKTCFTNKFK